MKEVSTSFRFVTLRSTWRVILVFVILSVAKRSRRVTGARRRKFQ